MLRAFLSLLMLSVGVSSADYWELREKIIEIEESASIGGKLKLNEEEARADQLLMAIKREEFSRGIANVSAFPAHQHFFLVKKDIERSRVFAFIKRLPKGASLHTHASAAVSFEYLFDNLTHRENLHACVFKNRLKLKFLQNANQSDLCQWELVENLRQNNDSYDEWMREQLTLEVKRFRDIYTDIRVIWKAFSNIFSSVYDLLAYRPVFEEYLQQVLLELLLDNVFYVEFRVYTMPLYELNGVVHDEEYFYQTCINVINAFKKKHPFFVGARFIYSPYRKINNTTAEEHVRKFLKLKIKYGDFIAGLDFVGFEEDGKSLKDFAPLLLQLQNKTNFFFHAGETNWYGTSIDLNLLDAVLLNSTRIGHAYAITKHPEISKLLFEKDIGVEICPIANQVLMLVEDLRNHPASVLIAQGYPVVICNDDPGFWGARGLSYDWYLAFMGMASEESGLKLLKQLAMNSITYSAMSEENKTKAFVLWETLWGKFIDDILALEML